MLQAIIFDFDGVIADTEPLHYRAFHDVLEGIGLPLPQSIYYAKYMGLSDRAMLRAALADAQRPDNPDLLEKLLRDKGDLYMAMIMDGQPLLPGVADFVDAAVRRWPVAICSGARHREIIAILSANDLVDRFGVIVSADDVRTSKPDPAGFLITLEQLRQKMPALVADHCLVFEDSNAGIQAARAAGMKVIAIQSRHGTVDASEATARIPDLASIDPSALHEMFD